MGAPALEASGLEFDVVVSSEAARSYKPEPAMFEAAALRLGVSLAHLLHVGDSGLDLALAEEEHQNDAASCRRSVRPTCGTACPGNGISGPPGSETRSSSRS